MDMFYNSEEYSVMAYPAQYGFELVDKTGHRSLFIQGARAEQFHKAIREVVGHGTDTETVDDFLSEYCAGAAKPIVYQ
jgi:hypothetical protein